MPVWVEQACQDYDKRLPAEITTNNILVPLIKRGKNPDIKRIVRDESRKLMAVTPDKSLLVALDVKGQALSTEKLSSLMDSWLQQGQDVSVLIGGPDGLSEELLSKASKVLSLSALTFPHPLVRVILQEQIYRSWSILKNHPYHRG